MPSEKIVSGAVWELRRCPALAEKMHQENDDGRRQGGGIFVLRSAHLIDRAASAACENALLYVVPLALRAGC